jgi:hypothetical protein
MLSFNGMRKALLLIVLGTGVWADMAYAQVQLRTLPASAKSAILGLPQPMPNVQLNRKVLQLAPGAVIFDQNNRIILQQALPVGAAAAFTTDMNGNVSRIYILTASEKAQFNLK